MISQLRLNKMQGQLSNSSLSQPNIMRMYKTCTLAICMHTFAIIISSFYLVISCSGVWEVCLFEFHKVNMHHQVVAMVFRVVVNFA